MQCLPASPGDVARFIMETGLSVDILHAELRAIDEQHEGLLYAPPAKSSVVIAAFNQLHPVEPPRSWPAHEKHLFLDLPHDLQTFFAKHEERREKEIRRAQNEAAECRRKLKEIEDKNAGSQAAA